MLIRSFSKVWNCYTQSQRKSGTTNSGFLFWRSSGINQVIFEFVIGVHEFNELIKCYAPLPLPSIGHFAFESFTHVLFVKVGFERILIKSSRAKILFIVIYLFINSHLLGANWNLRVGLFWSLNFHHFWVLFVFSFWI